MTTSLWVVVGIIGLVLAWHVWGVISSHVEQVEYAVLEKRDGYEIRLYPKHLVAQTTVTGPYRDAINQGFRIIAAYIFGSNAANTSIAMTAPVTETPKSEQIAMTAPVTAGLDSESRVIAFGMPKSYTRETLPRPLDSRIEIVELPEQKMAVRTFSWFTSDTRVAQQKEELLAALARDGVTATGGATYAGYNAPFTPPWLVRNEVMVQIQ